MNKPLPNSKIDLINYIQSTGMKIKEELRTGTQISLLVKLRQMPRYIVFTIVISPNAFGGTEIKSVYKLNWLGLLFNAGIFIGTAFVLVLLNILLIRESILEGLGMLIFNIFLITGLYFKLVHFSNEVLTGWAESTQNELCI